MVRAVLIGIATVAATAICAYVVARYLVDTFVPPQIGRPR